MHLSEIIRPKKDVISYLGLQYFVAILLLLLVSGCISLPPTEVIVNQNKKIYTPAQLREDLQFLDNSIRQIHPEPFARIDAEVYQALYQQLYLDLSWSQRRHDFYRLLAPLVAELADIHTRVLYPQQEYQDYLQQHGKFPLAVLNSIDGLIVVADLQQKPNIPVGAEIIAINDIAIETILEKFKDYVPAETVTGQRRMIQVDFARLMWSIYKTKTSYKVDYRWLGNSYQKNLIGVKQKLPAANISDISYYGALSINDQATLLWLNDFNEQKNKFDDFLDRHFQIIRDQNKDILILDLRYNQGGITDNLALLLTYLTAEPINWATRGTLKLSKAFRRQHSLMLGKTKSYKYGTYLEWLPVEYMNRWQWEILFASDGELVESEIETVISEKENYFMGKIYVLSNGYCFSACASLIATLKQNNRATIIGESPGSQTNVQYGYPVEVELPNSGLKLFVPAMKFVLDNSDRKEQRSILPDYQIERRKIDVMTGRDPVLDLAIELSKLQ